MSVAHWLRTASICGVTQAHRCDGQKNLDWEPTSNNCHIAQNSAMDSSSILLHANVEKLRCECELCESSSCLTNGTLTCEPASQQAKA